jgi:hypothetical protein
MVGSDTCFLLGDSWWNPDGSDLNKSRYFFMPVTVDAVNNTASITYYGHYNPLTGQYY